jgi:two-component system phosphate regulon sensor histidine kinase PhoR
VAETLQRELESGDENPAGEREVAILRGGDEVWLSLTEAVMRDDAGAVMGRVFAFRDVSAERAVETMKSEFVAAVSHELRTPLTSIYGFAETLLRQDVQFEESDRATFLGYIASESERLIRIVDDLLNVARLDAGTIGLDLGPVDVSETVAAALKREPRGEHRFVVDLPPGLVVLADVERLGEVVHHLVSNAVKFSPQGGTITIAGRPRAGMVEVRVMDEGEGIAPADRKRIFTKFFHGGDGVPDPGSGTGVGLFLARGLVAAMRGRLWVEPGEGRGSSFVFELPASNETAAGRRG